MSRVRIDKLVVSLGLAPSRDRARALIMTGNVLVNETPVTKAGTEVDPSAPIRLRGQDHPFVSRGGVKLDGALTDLAINVSGLVVLDVGASTGGFTDACLKRGATAVYAVDVGTNQLAYALRTDSRVTSLEKTNARHLGPEMLPGLADLAVIDVSFISITKVLPAVMLCLREAGAVLAMVKPQFEVGREKVGKGGVVRDASLRSTAVDNIVQTATALGLTYIGQADSRLKGPKGNLEIFVYFTKDAG